MNAQASPGFDTYCEQCEADASFAELLSNDGVCEECRKANYAEAALLVFEFTRWERMSDNHRDAEIRTALMLSNR